MLRIERYVVVSDYTGGGLFVCHQIFKIKMSAKLISFKDTRPSTIGCWSLVEYKYDEWYSQGRVNHVRDSVQIDLSEEHITISKLGWGGFSKQVIFQQDLDSFLDLISLHPRFKREAAPTLLEAVTEIALSKEKLDDFISSLKIHLRSVKKMNEKQKNVTIKSVSFDGSVKIKNMFDEFLPVLEQDFKNLSKKTLNGEVDPGLAKQEMVYLYKTLSDVSAQRLVELDRLSDQITYEEYSGVSSYIMFKTAGVLVQVEDEFKKIFGMIEDIKKY